MPLIIDNVKYALPSCLVILYAFFTVLTVVYRVRCAESTRMSNLDWPVATGHGQSGTAASVAVAAFRSMLLINARNKYLLSTQRLISWFCSKL